MASTLVYPCPIHKFIDPYANVIRVLMLNVDPSVDIKTEISTCHFDIPKSISKYIKSASEMITEMMSVHSEPSPLFESITRECMSIFHTTLYASVDLEDGLHDFRISVDRIISCAVTSLRHIYTEMTTEVTPTTIHDVNRFILSFHITGILALYCKFIECSCKPDKDSKFGKTLKAIIDIDEYLHSFANDIVRYMRHENTWDNDDEFIDFAEMEVMYGTINEERCKKIIDEFKEMKGIKESS